MKGKYKTGKSFWKGKKFSDIHRSNISKGGKGRVFTETTREKIRVKLTGNKNRLGVFGEKCGKSWKGGRTKVHASIRTSFRYRLWRSDVLTRDNFECTVCSSKDNLQADHIKAFRIILDQYDIRSLEDAYECEELWNINNGRTLCSDCHHKTETWGNRNV